LKKIESHPSKYNFLEPVKAKRNLPRNLIVSDVTMREGEQGLPYKMSLEQKLHLAEKLCEMGISQVQVGFAKSEEDLQVVKEIKKLNLPLKLEVIIQTYLDNWYEYFQAGVESGADIISMIYHGSEIRYQYIEEISHKEVLEFCQGIIDKIAHEKVIKRFSFSDATRGDLEFLKELSSKVVQGGADRVAFSDTSGAIMPAAMKHFVGEMVKNLEVPVQVHCHNDYGLAVANSLAAVEAGAQIVDVTLNGFGERAGNTPLEEFVMALIVFYDYELNLKTGMISELAHYVAEALRTTISPRKAIIGEEAFAHRHSSHVKMTEKYKFALETISPEVVGNKRQVGHQ